MPDKLTKDQYLEVEELLKVQFKDLKVWMTDKFVCQVDCGKRRGRIHIMIMSAAFIAVFSLGWKGIDLLKGFL